MQYFCGLKQFTTERPFHPTMFAHFRKRFPADAVGRINELIVARAVKETAPNKDHGDHDDPPPSGPAKGSRPKPESANKGKLLMDATCVPADITFPTDLKLLNKAREKSILIIDRLHELRGRSHKKPRTYRKRARKDLLNAAKSKRLGSGKLRKAIRAQLGYLKRNLSAIDNLSKSVSLTALTRREYRDLLVISETYRQQQWMYDHRSRRIDHRIVNISQPHVRPIKRGKTGKETEFGAKLSVSLINGYAFVDRTSWGNFNECLDLKAQVEAYKKRFGCYPESVHADRIYRTRENRRFCKERQIRLSGPRLGRPPRPTPENTARLREEAQLARQDELDRIPIEGKFGQGKRWYGIDRVMTKLAGTSETAIAICFLVMNLARWLAAILLRLFFKDHEWRLARQLTYILLPTLPARPLPII